MVVPCGDPRAFWLAGNHRRSHTAQYQGVQSKCFFESRVKKPARWLAHWGDADGVVLRALPVTARESLPDCDHDADPDDGEQQLDCEG